MAGGAAVRNFMTFDEAWAAWPIFQEAIDKLSDNLEIEGLPNRQYFTFEEYTRFYTVIYNIGSAKAERPAEAGKKLYDQYQRIFEDYISSKVLPSLRRKENENLLRELLRRWSNHKTMTRWLSRFFEYVSRYYIPRHGLPSLAQTSYLTFYSRVYGEIKDQVGNAIISLIDREREGEEIDRAMVEQVLDIFEEISEESLRNYTKHIEEAFKDISLVYSNRGLNLIATKSCEDFMLKVKECFGKEKTRSVPEYMRLANKDKVLEVYKEIKDQVNDAILSLGMVKLVLDAYEEIDEDALEYPAEDAEELVMDPVEEIGDDALEDDEEDVEGELDQGLYWTFPFKFHMLKVDDCFEKEKSRVSEYLTLNKQEQSE